MYMYMYIILYKWNLLLLWKWVCQNDEYKHVQRHDKDELESSYILARSFLEMEHLKKYISNPHICTCT